MIDTLPEDLIYLIVERLSIPYIIRLVCKRLWKLTLLTSNRVYQCQPSAINKILSLYNNIKLHVDMSNCRDLHNVNHLSRCYSLNLSYCTSLRDVSALGQVHWIDLSYCTAIRDISSLSCHTLILSGCNNVNLSTGQWNRIKKLIMCHHPIDNVTQLAPIKELYLDDCPNIEDVSPLRNCHTLSLYNCKGVRNITPLYNVINLDTRGCSLI